MKYHILESFLGSPDGRFAVQYHAGTVEELTDSLAAVAVMEGWAKLYEEKPPVEEKPAEPVAPVAKKRGRPRRKE